MPNGHIKIDLSKCFVDWYEIDFAQRVYVCRNRDYPHPIGMVWGQKHYTTGYTHFAVDGSYVPEWARRQGVRRLINETILKEFKAVTSPGGTKEGAAFMKASGYRRDPLHGWVLNRTKGRANRK